MAGLVKSGKVKKQKNYSEMMDSDNSNRKTSHFHAQKILDAAADNKTKKERQNDLIWKTRLCNYRFKKTSFSVQKRVPHWVLSGRQTYYILLKC